MAGRVTARLQVYGRAGRLLSLLTQMSSNSVRLGTFNVTRLVIKMAEKEFTEDVRPGERGSKTARFCNRTYTCEQLQSWALASRKEGKGCEG